MKNMSDPRGSEGLHSTAEESFPLRVAGMVDSGCPPCHPPPPDRLHIACLLQPLWKILMVLMPLMLMLVLMSMLMLAFPHSYFD